MEGEFMALRVFPGSAVLLACILLVSGCNQKAFMVRSMDPIMDDMKTAVNRSVDVDLVKDALPASLIQLDGFIVAAPNDALLLRGAESYFGYANAFVEDMDKKRAGLLYLKARGYGLQVLKGNDRFARALDGPEPEFKEMLKGLDKSSVPALFWTANSWLAWIGITPDDPQALMDIPKVVDMLERVIELDESFYFGSAHAALGSYYASLPRVMGDKTATAKQHFDRAFALSGGRFLFMDFLYAKFYAYQIQDRDLFVRTLEKILSTPSDRYPDAAFANEVVKRKARVLLDNVDTYF